MSLDTYYNWFPEKVVEREPDDPVECECGNIVPPSEMRQCERCKLIGCGNCVSLDDEGDWLCATCKDEQNVANGG